MPAHDSTDHGEPRTDTDESLESLATRLLDHLEATGELPIDREPSRWLGEAEAVARDAATNDLDDATIRKRVRQVSHLLEEAGETGNEEANAHLESARESCARILERDR